MAHRPDVTPEQHRQGSPVGTVGHLDHPDRRRGQTRRRRRWVADDVTEGLRVSAVEASVEVGRPRVVAGAGAGMLRPVAADVVAAVLRSVAGAVAGALVAVGHPLPVPEPGVDLRKARPPRRHLVPALHHEGVHPAGAVLRTRQQLSGPAPLENIHTKHDTFSSVAEPEQVRAGAEL